MPKKSLDVQLAELIESTQSEETKIRLLEIRAGQETIRRQNAHERAIQRMKDKPESKRNAVERRQVENLEAQKDEVPLGQRVNDILAGMTEVKKEVTQ